MLGASEDIRRTMNRWKSSLNCTFLILIIQLFGDAAFGQMPALSPLPQTGTLSAPAHPKQFTFVLAGDNRPAHNSCPQPPTPGKIFSAVKQMNPSAAFVLWTGDTISGKEPEPKRIQAEYQEFLGIAKTAGVPVFNAPGNHELDDGNNAPSGTMKKLYRKYMAGTYGAFSYGNSRFIALDSENKPFGKSKSLAKKGEAPGAITQKQLTLLQQDLDANKDKTHVVIFMHHPAQPYDAEDGLDDASVKALEKMFKNYSNVSYVISGHEHMYYNSQGDRSKYVAPPSRTDPAQPPFYLVSGGGGAPLKNNTPGSFFHYIVFNVDGNKISPTLVKVDSSDPCDKGN